MAIRRTHQKQTRVSALEGEHGIVNPQGNPTAPLASRRVSKINEAENLTVY